MAVELDAVDRDAAAVGFIKAAEEVKQRAFAAAGGAAEGDGLAFDGFEVDALEDGDGAIVVALPDLGGAEDDADGCARAWRSRMSFETQRLHRSDTHGVEGGIERAGDSGQEGQDDDDRR